MSRAGTIRQMPNCSDTVFVVSGSGRMKMIYCKCGRIIGLDSSQVNLKIKLGKELECTKCRNARIARELDDLNGIADCVEEEIL